jgi:thioredoxin reductase (NADPH)
MFMSDAGVRAAFPRLDGAELESLRRIGVECAFAEGERVFAAGDADIDMHVVLEGAIRVVNPTDHGRTVAVHGPGEFAGDIDLLTRRPVIVTAVASGPTRTLRVPGGQVRRMLSALPHLSEKLIDAFTVRRAMLEEAGVAGMTVKGGGLCPRTTRLREFLHRNFVPFAWERSDAPPSVRCLDGTVLQEPSLRELAACAGVWRGCPEREVDLAVVGAGPAGLAAAVYAASEGLKTLVLDRLGPGGQVAGSSRIENFIGFPSGLSGAELAMRGVLQMLKFGATLAAPVEVTALRPAAGPGGAHTLELDCDSTVSAGVVLAATGARWRRLEARGAARFERAGVYYSCTAVESFAHDNEDVVVVGPGNSAGQAAMYLAEACPGRTVHMLVRGPELGPGMSEYLCKRVLTTRNIRVRTGVEVGEVVGDERVREVVVRERDGGGEVERVAATGVFVFIGAEPHAGWLPEAVARDAKGYVLTGEDARKSGRWGLDSAPCTLETTVPGVLCAGDVRSGSTKRVGFAVGDGSLAVTCVHAVRARQPARAGVTGSR